SVDLRSYPVTDLVWVAEASQQTSGLVGSLLQPGFNRGRSGHHAESRCGIVPAGRCCIPQSICAGAALRHGDARDQVAKLWLWRCPDLLRLFLPDYWLSDLQV